MVKRFAAPGRAAGSYVIPSVESVTAPLIFDRTFEVLSVRRMRECKSGDDLDILDEGSFSESTRHEDAEGSVNVSALERHLLALTDDMLRKREQGPLPLEGAVEAFGEIAAELDVLLLILPDGYMGRAIAC